MSAILTLKDLLREQQEDKNSIKASSVKSNRLSRKRDLSKSSNKSLLKGRDNYDNNPAIKFMVSNKNLSTQIIKQQTNELQQYSLREQIKERNNHSRSKSRSRSLESSDLRKSLNKKNKNPEDRKGCHQITPQKTDVTPYQNSFSGTTMLNKFSNLQADLQQMQISYNHQKQCKQSLEQELHEKNETINDLRKLVMQLQIQNSFLQKQRQIYIQKVENLKTQVLQTQSNFINSQNTVEKLKNSINQNKINQLQLEVKKLSKCSETQRKNIKLMEKQRSRLLQDLTISKQRIEELQTQCSQSANVKKESMKEQYLIKEVQKLKQQLKLSKEQKESFLEQNMKAKDDEIYRLNCQAKLLKMQIHFIQQSKQRQMMEIIRKKQSQLKKIKQKNVKLLAQKKEKQISSKSLQKIRPTVLNLIRRDSLSFSLSPQLKQ